MPGIWLPLNSDSGGPAGAGDLLVLDGVTPLEPVGNDDDATDWLYADPTS